MTLEEFADAAPIPAAESEPSDIGELLAGQRGPYVRSDAEPSLDFGVEEVPGVPGMWQIIDNPGGEEILTAIPGGERTELEPTGGESDGNAIDGTQGYRPPWVPHEFVPRLTPFRTAEHPSRVYMEPRASEAERLTYPWRTNGLVLANGRPAGSGVLVGPNLMLTASHVAPWDANPWSMEFIPGFRQGERPPFGSSFVSQFRGFRVPAGEATGYDYVICRLYTPLGRGLGWMGSVAFGSENEYYRRRYNSTGYPSSFQGRPAVEFNMSIVDIDNDDPGLELEFSRDVYQLGPGWSGGPLWLPNEGPLVAGTVTGQEKDVFDPTRFVISAGFGMTNLVKFGLANWPV
ncbi:MULTISPECIES: trypsin-like serine peptidase [Streptomyces]|uniref:Serine protease n=1 Tax=Streptomyces sudanensis TaxID=436397 RepID=A0ABY4TEK5_9ACTN|nr:MULTISPECIES: hypothetical protein [Streptomyces]MCP9985999.1 hypothetical protein [Streptomyces sudanensis]URN17367.1 hypothetical protein MW084_17170 [Streptomyces sudanensis]